MQLRCLANFFIKLFNDQTGTNFRVFSDHQARRRKRERKRERESSLILRVSRRPLKSDKLSPIAESPGFSMLILKNLAKSSAVLYERFIGSPASLPLYRSHQRTSEREPLNFVNLTRNIFRNGLPVLSNPKDPSAL